MASLLEILPGVVKELVKHVPELALEITDWNSVKRDLPVITRRIFMGSGVDQLKEAQERRIGAFITHSTRSVPKEPTADAKAKGDALLRFYFAQLFCPEGIFVDLRDSKLHWDTGKLLYSPSGFWYRFSDPFRAGILTLYDGFYSADDSKFEAGLIATGLLDRNWEAADQLGIKTIFRAHFGSNLDHPMRFSLRQFQENFLKIFEFLLRKKVRLSSEFMIFGIYLVTLYLSLEKYGSEHEVKSLYQEVARSGIK
ncbi:MAG: hypothetical protein KGP28_08030 [Bdellovibrionales bacterium]|nr:hypothetical protein [Bdellovibrionales bacterium]